MSLARHAEERKASAKPEDASARASEALSPEPTVAGILALQRSAGNNAVARLLQRQPVDEQEAATDTDTDAEKKRRPLASRPVGTATSTAAQKKGKASNAYGTFTYDITTAAGKNGCDTSISFEAFSPEVVATRITMIQTAKSTKGGAIHYPNGDSAYYQPLEAPSGVRTDATKSETDPFYNFEDKTGTDETTGTTGATTTTMADGPALNIIPGKDASQTFETAPFVLSGTDEGEFLGTITWGWSIDAAGAFTLNEVTINDDITTDFGAALRKFIARKHETTKTGTTPAPASLEMPLDKCRELTAAENLALKPFADYAKLHANARIWVTARHVSKLGSDANHDMAIDNARTVQVCLKTLGVADASVHITALVDPAAKPLVSPIEVTVIDT